LLKKALQVSVVQPDERPVYFTAEAPRALREVFFHVLLTPVKYTIACNGAGRTAREKNLSLPGKNNIKA